MSDDVVEALRRARDVLAEVRSRKGGEAVQPAISSLEAALRLADSQEPKRDLLAVICHDLKDPLASIVMGVGFLKKVLPDEPAMQSARRVVEAIHRSADRMNHVVGDFHDLSKLEGGTLLLEPGTYEAAAIARAAVDLFSARATEKTLTIATAFLDGGARVTCDRARTVSVLSKLLANAIKFSAAGQEIRVETSAPKGGQVRFAVSDVGRGVPGPRRGTIFDREANQQATPRDGPGLGLAIAKGLVELERGAIGYAPVEPQGSLFWFTLPAA